MQQIGNKLVLVAGSAGLPFTTKKNILRNTTVNYLILEESNKKINYKFKDVPYRSQLVLQDILEINYLVEGGPITWILLYSFLSQQDQFGDLLRKHSKQGLPNDETELALLCKKFLIKNKVWTLISKYLKNQSPITSKVIE